MERANSYATAPEFSSQQVFICGQQTGKQQHVPVRMSSICKYMFSSIQGIFQSLVAFEDVYLEATCVASDTLCYQSLCKLIIHSFISRTHKMAKKKKKSGSQVVFSTVGSSLFNRNIVSWPRSSNLLSFK